MVALCNQLTDQSHPITINYKEACHLRPAIAIDFWGSSDSLQEAPPLFHKYIFQTSVNRVAWLEWR